ncbi:MAG: chorismate-binding protein, partial [Gammaproteobacteria bacterium]|nr:chorismate-binding protein [Gammaproteobacteria bacterium]
ADGSCSLQAKGSAEGSSLAEGSQSGSNQKKSQLDLFAGAGLVAESTPDAEWQETELKMQTILEML